MADMMAARALLTTREVADYLRIKDRKVYNLVRERRIPFVRVPSKWLFPKALIELWVMQNSEGRAQVKSAVERPPVVAGSHDPLLEWVVRESDCELAIMFNGSLDGLNRFAQGKAYCCGLHVFDPDSGEYNRAVVARALVSLEVVLIEWARRDQGLIVAAGNPHPISDLSGLRQARLRLAERPEWAGSRLLFYHLLQAHRVRHHEHRMGEGQNGTLLTTPRGQPAVRRRELLAPRSSARSGCPYGSCPRLVCRRFHNCRG